MTALSYSLPIPCFLMGQAQQNECRASISNRSEGSVCLNSAREALSKGSMKKVTLRSKIIAGQFKEGEVTLFSHLCLYDELVSEQLF